MPDREHVNTRKSAFYIFRIVYFVFWIIIGIVMANKIVSTSHSHMNDKIVADKIVAGNLIVLFVLLFVVGVATMISYYCCCDGTDVLTIMDERLQQKVKPVVDLWNSTVQEHEVFAEFKVTKVDGKEKGKMVRIPPTLKVWKHGDLESESLV